MDKVNLSQKFSLFTSHWDPKIVGEVNGHQVKLVKFHGPFVWHRHENDDELFLVHKGRFTMEFRDRRVPIEEGEFIIVPRDTEHRPVAEEAVHVILFEPATTLNTGDVQSGATLQLASALDAAGKRTEARPLWKKMLDMAVAANDTATADTARARLMHAP